jgi:hypothetical protein
MNTSLESPSLPSMSWREASNLAPFRWPARVAIAGTLVTAANLLLGSNNGLTIGPVHLYLLDAFYIFAILLISTFPIWYYCTNRVYLQQPQPKKAKQIAVVFAFFFLALLLCPTVTMEYRTYGYYDNITKTLIKRSFLETINQPWFDHDELTWLQSSSSTAYIPAEIYCPYRSTRLRPFIGYIRTERSPGVLTLGGGDDVNSQPPTDALNAVLEHCRREGPAMRSAGLVKEAALMRGDINQFFFLTFRDETPNNIIVLEDSAFPPDLMAKINVFLANQSLIAKIDVFLANQPSDFEYLDNADFASHPGMKRRLKPLAVAAALNRNGDIERLKAAH